MINKEMDNVKVVFKAYTNIIGSYSEIKRINKEDLK